MEQNTGGGVSSLTQHRHLEGTSRLPISGTFVLIGGLIGFPLTAQSVAVRGLVGDSVLGWPVSDALILLDDAADSTVTDPSGVFVLRGVSAGPHVISITAFGFRVQQYEMVIQPHLGSEQDVGLIVLAPLPDVTVRLTGTVRDTLISAGIEEAEVILAASARAQTDPTGRFTTDSVRLQPGYYMAVVRAIGFYQAPFQVTVAESGDILVDVPLERLPVFLPDIEVWAEAFRRERLREFYWRSKSRPGRFLDPAKVDSMRTTVTRVSDLFARMPGITIRPSANGRTVEFLRCGDPLIVLNDVPMRGTWTVDDVVGLEQVTAIEVYRPAEVPLQYSFSGGCGAIILWTY